MVIGQVLAGGPTLTSLNLYGNTSGDTLLELAEAGDREAQYEMGRRAYESRDFKSAREWFGTSCGLGYKLAHEIYEWMLNQGEGGPLILEGAEPFYLDAARKGQDSAKAALAEIKQLKSCK